MKTGQAADDTPITCAASTRKTPDPVALLARPKPDEAVTSTRTIEG